MNNHILRFPNPAPACGGTGLLALDAVFNGDPDVKPNYWAGGSCGNVLTILSYLEWRSYPIARLGNDPAAKKLISDLQRFKVRLDFIHTDKSINTPVIVERIHENINGFPTHRFYLICPNCGSWFPRYRPIPLRTILNLSNKMPIFQCFYFDRVSPAALGLAKLARETGALVVFEPHSFKDEANFIRAIQISHIVKYAHERSCNIDKLKVNSYPFLLIETLGSEGLRYQFRRKVNSPKIWKTLPAYDVNDFRDAAGAGDWCSAGIINLLGKNGAKDISHIHEENVIEALRFGQAMAAFNCRFEGARGCMYKIDKRTFIKAVMDIMKKHNSISPIPESISGESKNLLMRICLECKRVRKKKKKSVSLHSVS